MSRSQITHVDYGRHHTGRWLTLHPPIANICIPIDVLGVIMDVADPQTKMSLGRADRRLYRILRGRIMAAQIHVKRPAIGGYNIRDEVQLRRITDLYNHTPRIKLDTYAYLIAPKCENCGIVIRKKSHQRDPHGYWEHYRSNLSVMYVGMSARYIHTTLCGRNLCLGMSMHDTAIARMHMANHNLSQYEEFYTVLSRYSILGDDVYYTQAMLLLSRSVRYVVERKYIRKEELTRWHRLNHDDFIRYLQRDLLPLHALQYTIFRKIIDCVSLRDIKMMKCVSKLQKITFTGAELYYKKFVAT